MLNLLFLLAVESNFESALARAQRNFPQQAIPADLVAQLDSVNCKGLGRIGLGEVNASIGSGPESKDGPEITYSAGTMTFVRCDNGDEFVLQISGKAETKVPGQDTMRGGAIFVSDATKLQGRPSAYEVNRRRDGVSLYRLGWQVRAGWDAIVVVYDAKTAEDGKRQVYRIADRLLPVLK